MMFLASLCAALSARGLRHAFVSIKAGGKCTSLAAVQQSINDSTTHQLN
jgi:hypothetical protein